MHSSFRDSESYLRILCSLDENDLQLILKQYNSKFTKYKFPPGVYTFKDICVVLSRGFRIEFEVGGWMRPIKKYGSHNSILIKLITLLIIKFKLRNDIKVMRFHKKSLFNTILSFSP